MRAVPAASRLPDYLPDDCRIGTPAADLEGQCRRDKERPTELVITRGRHAPEAIRTRGHIDDRGRFVCHVVDAGGDQPGVTAVGRGEVVIPGFSSDTDAGRRCVARTIRRVIERVTFGVDRGYAAGLRVVQVTQRPDKLPVVERGPAIAGIPEGFIWFRWI